MKMMASPSEKQPVVVVMSRPQPDDDVNASVSGLQQLVFARMQSYHRPSVAR